MNKFSTCRKALLDKKRQSLDRLFELRTGCLSFSFDECSRPRKAEAFMVAWKFAHYVRTIQLVIGANGINYCSEENQFKKLHFKVVFAILVNLPISSGTLIEIAHYLCIDSTDLNYLGLHIIFSVNSINLFFYINHMCKHNII